jgi:hypothetical protein
VKAPVVVGKHLSAPETWRAAQLNLPLVAAPAVQAIGWTAARFWLVNTLVIEHVTCLIQILQPPSITQLAETMTSMTYFPDRTGSRQPCRSPTCVFPQPYLNTNFPSMSFVSQYSISKSQNFIPKIFPRIASPNVAQNVLRGQEIRRRGQSSPKSHWVRRDDGWTHGRSAVCRWRWRWRGRGRRCGG